MAVGACAVVRLCSSVLSAVPSRLIAAVSSVPGATASAGQESATVPRPSPSAVNTVSMTCPSGPVTATVYSVSGRRPV